MSFLIGVFACVGGWFCWQAFGFRWFMCCILWWGFLLLWLITCFFWCSGVTWVLRFVGCATGGCVDFGLCGFGDLYVVLLSSFLFTLVGSFVWGGFPLRDGFAVLSFNCIW